MKFRVTMFTALAAFLLLSSNSLAHVGYFAYDACCTPVFVHTSYYAPLPTPVYPSAAVVRSRHRPLLGGTVTRVRMVEPTVVYEPCCW